MREGVKRIYRLKIRDKRRTVYWYGYSNDRKVKSYTVTCYTDDLFLFSKTFRNYDSFKFFTDLIGQIHSSKQDMYLAIAHLIKDMRKVIEAEKEARRYKVKCDKCGNLFNTYKSYVKRRVHHYCKDCWPKGKGELK
jgi:uncharacterized OB-fold protein